jgi:hypothetical protein
VGVLVAALAVIVFIAAVVSFGPAKRLAVFVAAALIGAVVHAGTGDWSVTIAAVGVLLVAAAFVATTRDLVSILRTSA